MDENGRFLDKLQSGDRQAFRILVEKYQPMIQAIGIQMFEGSEDNEDFIQEVFIKIYHALPNFRRKSSLSTWIYRIALNHALNLVRKNKWKKWLMNGLNPFGTNHAMEQAVQQMPGQIEENAEQRELRKLLTKAIQRLPENQRIAFVMTRIDGLSYAEVAEVMGISEAAVDSLTQRARQNLRKHLSTYYKYF